MNESDVQETAARELDQTTSSDGSRRVKPVEISIVGSCVTRDAFSSRFCPDYGRHFTVACYVEQTSLLSLMDRPSPEYLDEIDNLDPYELTQARNELTKEGLACLLRTRPSYLVVDFFADVHFGVIKHESRYFTNNRWTISKTAFFQRLESGKRLNGLDSPEEYFELWRDAVDRFMALVRRGMPDTRIVLHKARSVDRYLDENGRMQSLVTPTSARQFNILWERMDDYFEQTYQPLVIDLAAQARASFSNHPWGKFSVHYTLDYYRSFIAELQRLAEDDLARDAVHGVPTASSPDREFSVSVVMPVYNVEVYLEAAIESLLRQTVGFENNIQLILVDDGSEDGSGDICKSYRDAHPSNIIYVRQQNAGVSSARNRGLELATGTYVNFLDADDKWAINAVEEALTFFRKHPDVDIVAAKQTFFGAHKGDHPLNYRFKEERVVDIHSDYQYPQLAVNCVFFRRSAIQGQYFDSRLIISEDFRFITPLILEKGKYGVLKNTRYWYRRRHASNSAINQSTRLLTWYVDTPQYCYRDLFEYSLNTYGSVLPYVQYCVMYDLQWRLMKQVGDTLDDEGVLAYRATIAGLLQSIREEIIVEQRRLPVEHKIQALALKRGTNTEAIKRSLRLEGDRVYLGAMCVRQLSQEGRVVVEIMQVRDGSLLIEGHIKSAFSIDDISMRFVMDGSCVEATLFDRPERAVRSLGEKIQASVGFSARVPIAGSGTLKAELAIQNREIRPRFTFEKFARLNEEMRTTYFQDCGYVFSLSKGGIRIRKDVRRRHLYRRELNYLVELVEKGHRSLIGFRLARHLVKALLGTRRVWLVSDRVISAGDSGDALFRHLSANPIKGVLPFFVISRDSADYAVMKGVGRVVSHGSLGHRVLFLLSDKIVSSAAEDNVINPFGRDRRYLKDLYAFDFVFLQHGVTKDDLSAWLNKYNKNIRLFITSASMEHKSIVEGDYYYSANEVQLTGFPRHDLLRVGSGEPERKILIMPTWRKNLTHVFNQQTGLRPAFPGFENSDYAMFYNALINDPRLVEVLSRCRYRGVFVLHPSIAHEAHHFRGRSNSGATTRTSSEPRACSSRTTRAWPSTSQC